MYHYYVRYSIFSKGKKVGDGSTECTTRKKITQRKQLEELIEGLKEDEKNYFPLVDTVMIDFYQLLGRSFR